MHQLSKKLVLTAFENHKKNNCGMNATANSRCDLINLPLTQADLLCILNDQKLSVQVQHDKTNLKEQNFHKVDVGCATETIITVKGLELKKAGTEALVDAVIKYGAFPKCKRLDLSNNEILDTGLIVLTKSFREKAFSMCTSLNLAINKISDTGLIALKDSFSMNLLPKLKCLDLSENHIGNTGIIALLTQVHVEELYLKDNEIGDEGIQAFSEKPHNFVILDLNFNRFGDAGMRALAHAIQAGALPSLKKLNVRNRFQDAPVESSKNSIEKKIDNSPEVDMDITCKARCIECLI